MRTGGNIAHVLLIITAIVGLAAISPVEARASGPPEATEVGQGILAEPGPFYSFRLDAEGAGATDSSSVLAGARSASEIRSELLFREIHRGLVGPAQNQAGAAVGSRSVPLAFGLSAVLPGLGQAYNRHWIKGAVAIAVESGLIAAYVLWRDRGLEMEDAYQHYAHAHWNPARYAEWLNAFSAYLESEHGAVVVPDPVNIPEQIDFSAPEGWSDSDWTRVHAFFDEIRNLEGELFHPETGASFSHVLPYFGEQQYYELVGKYFQFAPGWDDYPEWMRDGDYTEAIDPERSGPGGAKVNVRGRFFEYASDHADANTLLRRASRISGVIILNHILAAFDAAISSKLHNDRIGTGLTLGYDHLDNPEIRASVSWSF